VTWKKGLAIGCGGCLLLCLVAAAAVVGWMVYVGQNPRGVEVTVEGPLDVAVGDTFSLQVTVSNQRKDQPFALTDIDIAEEYLEAFTVVATTPNHVSSMHVPIDNTRSFTFDRPVAPGETATFTFELRAEREGLQRGDVDVCEGARFLTKMAQTTVQPRRGEPEAARPGG